MARRSNANDKWSIEGRVRLDRDGGAGYKP
jgi:hypothetical protein